MSSASTNSLLVAGLVAALAVAAAGFLPTTRYLVRGAAAVLLAVGPVLALVLIGHARSLILVIAVGAAALGAIGCLTAQARSSAALHTIAAAIAATAAVIAGLRIGPTGVEVLDVAGAFVVVLVVTLTFAGFDRPGGAATTIAIPAAAGVLALAGFANQDTLAALSGVALATAAASFTFRAGGQATPVEQGARLLVGYAVSAGALAVLAVDRDGRPASTAITLLALLVLDAAIVVFGRLRSRCGLWSLRRDHLVDRLVARRWRRALAVAALLVVQLGLSILAVFSGRGVLTSWVAPTVALLVIVALALVAGRARLPRPGRARAPRHVARWVAVGAVAVVVVVIAGAVPSALAAPDVADTMERGRDAAKEALSKARDGETLSAAAAFETATAEFADAKHELSSPRFFAARAVPYVAANINAARVLADVGETLADAGRSITIAIDPDTLEVVDGRLPMDTVRSITPDLDTGARALREGLERIDRVLDEPYLVGRIRSAVTSVREELVRAKREAEHAELAARLAPALFGVGGERRYLLVVQNNAESRPTGGFIGSYAVVTATDGKLSVGEVKRTKEWNEALRALPEVPLVAPADYRTQYAQFLPQTTLQNVNLTADFPTVAGVLMNLAPAAGVGPVDGVISVDPDGLAALLELTGPVTVDAWPEPINADNVVSITLKEAYAAFSETPERADFLGDVARAAVDKATSGTLGSPARIADVLGKAAHEGHVQLAFARPEEQALAEELDVSGGLAPVRSDALAVASSNMTGNKVDPYLQRHVDYDIAIEPGPRGTRAEASAKLRVQLDNSAPAEGLPEIVIGPFLPQFVAGQNRMYLEVYTPLAMTASTLDGASWPMNEFEERDRNVYARFVSVFAQSSKTLDADLAGVVDLPGGWYNLDLKHQALLNDDTLGVKVSVPKEWRIDRARGLKITGPRTAEGTRTLERDETLRVHLVRSSHDGDLWSRLVAGE